MKHFRWIDRPGRRCRRQHQSSMERFVFARIGPVVLTRLCRFLPSREKVAAQLEAEVVLVHLKILDQERASSLAPLALLAIQNAVVVA